MSEDGSKMVCTKSYNRQSGMQSPPDPLLRDRYPRYFSALEGSLAIDAHEALRDERTAEFAQGYLDVSGVTSMLAVTIRRNARMAGVLCHEHTGTPRVWSSIERDFVMAIADFIVAAQEAGERRLAETEKERLIHELQDALAHVKMLSGLLPICAGCKKIRDDHGYWSQIESYICQHSEAQFSHGLCPDCSKRYFPECEEEI